MTRIAKAESTATLTVVIQGLQNKNGQVCLRIYGNERGFPLSSESEVQSGCTQINGSSVTKKFSGLKPGTYAVAVVDDKNRDTKLNRNFLGIPQEGFGISNNPTVSVRTGMPKFQDASFSLKQDKTINIVMKYSLDPS
ncbi:MAG: DUF2141 domain-containing protein [Microcystaceae cyanobacterium]